jgi:hypothetical protein
VLVSLMVMVVTDLVAVAHRALTTLRLYVIDS